MYLKGCTSQKRSV